MSKFLKYIEEVCDGSGIGPKDGTRNKKRKRKGKMDEASSSFGQYAIGILEDELKKLGFKKSGRVLTLKGDDNVKISKAQDLVDAINILTGSKMKIKVHDGFTDIVYI